MIIVMRMGASPEEIQNVVDRVNEIGFRTHLSQGEERTIIGVIGDERPVDKDSLARMQGVERIVPILRPFKLASRDFQPHDTLIDINGHTVGGQQITVMAGPCAVESRELILETAHVVKEAGAHLLRGGAFKPRTSPYSFQGLGEEALTYLAEAREATGLPVVTEVMSPEQIPLVKMGEGFGMWWQPSRPGIWELSRDDGVASTFRLACSGGQDEVSLDGENFKFIFPPGSLPPETCVRAEPERVSGVSELDLLGDGVTLIPEYVPILKPFTVRMRVADRGADGQTAIYRVSGKAASWLKTQRAGEWLVAESSASGNFVVAADRQAPTAGPWKIAAREEAPNRPRIRVAVADRGSGISEWGLYCGDRWLLSAYDPDAGEIIWEGDEELPGPAADLRLTLTDRAGNQSAWTYEASPERRPPAKKSAKSKKQ